MVRAWLVDLDGTLYRPLPVKLCMAGELLLFGRRSLTAIRAFRVEHEALRAEGGRAPQSPYELQLDRAAEGLGMQPAELALQVEEWMQRRPGRWLRAFRRKGLLHELEAFHAGGGLTALVSDYPAERKLEALGARALFDVVVANGEAGGPKALKPDPDGYLLAARRLGVEPQECLVIGDREDADGEAAKRAGMAFRLIR